MSAPQLLRAREAEQPHARVLRAAVHEDVQVERLGERVVLDGGQERREAFGHGLLAVCPVELRCEGDLLDGETDELALLVVSPEDWS